jgi:hypothetical protein
MVITAPWSAPRVTHARAGQFPAMSGGALAALRRLVAAPSAFFASDEAGNDGTPSDEVAPDEVPATAG